MEQAHLCQCNKCEIVLIDQNPQINAQQHVLTGEEMEMLCVKDDAGEYYVCPKCLSDDHLQDEITLPLWHITDPGTGQIGRRLSVYKFEFKEGERQYIIDLEKYTMKDIMDATESFHENLDELATSCGSDTCWIIAECLFEMDIIKT